MREAILQFLTSTNITGIRSSFGLIDQVSHAFSQAKIMAPFQELLKTKRQKFYWDDTLNHLFEKSKQVIV